MKTVANLIITIIFIIIFSIESSFGNDEIIPQHSSSFQSTQTVSKKNKDTAFLTENNFSPTFFDYLEELKNNELYKLNLYESYDANFKYKLDLNFYNRKLELVPKIRITKKIEERLKTDPDSQKELESNVKTDINQEKTISYNSATASTQTNSIFVGMDLSYALNKTVSLDSNLSFYQAAMEFFDKKNNSKNNYKYEANGMSVSIGLRKQVTDSFSAGLLYSWQKWLNETENFKETHDPDEEKASHDDPQEAFNLILRYDF